MTYKLANLTSPVNGFNNAIAGLLKSLKEVNQCFKQTSNEKISPFFPLYPCQRDYLWLRMGGFNDGAVYCLHGLRCKDRSLRGAAGLNNHAHRLENI